MHSRIRVQQDVLYVCSIFSFNYLNCSIVWLQCSVHAVFLFISISFFFMLCTYVLLVCLVMFLVKVMHTCVLFLKPKQEIFTCKMEDSLFLYIQRRKLSVSTKGGFWKCVKTPLIFKSLWTLKVRIPLLKWKSSHVLGTLLVS